MITSRAFSGKLFLGLVGLLTPLLLESCGFCPTSLGELCEIRHRAVLTKLTSSSQTKIFESANTLIAFHGVGCAESNRTGVENVVTVAQSIDLPAYVTNATVFLNGWDTQYLEGDHHVAGLGTLIDSIRLEGHTLKWQATGIISDDNFDDGYQWCYHYTVIGWNAAGINLVVDQHDGNCNKPTSTDGNFYAAENTNTTTALSSFPSILLNKGFAGSKVVAILPRGFGFNWSECGTDHHLFQIAYNIGHSEVFAEYGKQYKKMGGEITPALSNSASQVGSGYVSWESSVIFKDNDDRRRYTFGEMVSGLGGTDLGMIEPPFSILIRPQSDGALASGGVLKKKYMITNIPYNYALPVLTGWDLSYLTSDNHVRESGAWIDNIHYEKSPVTQTGTLTYELSTVLRDEDNWPDFYSRHKVTVLGFQASTGRIPKSSRVRAEALPDLIPFSPLGDGPTAFTRIEQGKLLRVTIKNQGNAHAGPSKTTLHVGGILSITNGTAAIPMGDSVDVLFTLPEAFINADQPFTITVDADDEVNEGANEGNNSTNGRHPKRLTN